MPMAHALPRGSKFRNRTLFDSVRDPSDLWATGFINVFIGIETWMSEVEKEVSNDEVGRGRNTRKPSPESYGDSDALNVIRGSLRWALP